MAMALDSEPTFISHPAPELPLAERLPPEIVTPDEQTPLLKPDGALAGNGTPAGIPAPRPRTDDVTAFSGSRRLPQAIAHRGYTVVAPENSMLAFRAAVQAGAHAIETDLHLSKDGVVVLSHDASLKRCFGEDSKVRDHEWSYLSTLRTLRKPAQPMPRLLDLLEYLNQPGLENIWIMLDIKRDDDATELVRRTAETISSVHAIRPWKDRILPCCWTAQYVKLSQKFLPGFPIAHVGFSSIYARALAARVPGLSVSMLRYMLAMPITGSRFIRDMKRSGHPIHVWTVNDEDWMEWSIRKELDGVITDDPKLFLEVCSRATEKEAEGKSRKSIVASLRIIRRDLYDWVRYVLFIIVLMTIYFFRNGLPQIQVRKMLGN
ncbi:PLC-like phosphodiesterase [Hypoxylon sp. FL0543]|nr:PLC-like phosphodiesterase [Hypoxylon sp. FL0543]